MREMREKWGRYLRGGRYEGCWWKGREAATKSEAYPSHSSLPALHLRPTIGNIIYEIDPLPAIRIRTDDRSSSDPDLRTLSVSLNIHTRGGVSAKSIRRERPHRLKNRLSQRRITHQSWIIPEGKWGGEPRNIVPYGAGSLFPIDNREG